MTLGNLIPLMEDNMMIRLILLTGEDENETEEELFISTIYNIRYGELRRFSNYTITEINEDTENEGVFQIYIKFIFTR